MDREAGGFYHCMSRVAGGEFTFEVRSGRCPVAGKFVELMKKSRDRSIVVASERTRDRCAISPRVNLTAARQVVRTLTPALVGI